MNFEEMFKFDNDRIYKEYYEEREREEFQLTLIV